MSEDSSPQEAAVGPRASSSLLVDAHFEPGEVAYHFSPTFTMDDIKASLFESRYSHPKPVTLRLALYDNMDLPVVVSRLEPLYMPIDNGHSRTSRELACHEVPDWYVEGWVLMSGFHPSGEIVRVRIYLTVNGTAEDWSEGWIQRIPKNPDPDGVIVEDDASIHA